MKGDDKNRMVGNDGMSVAAGVPAAEECQEAAQPNPQIVEIGKATDLIQSYSSGKYSDGYTGYYWER